MKAYFVIPIINGQPDLPPMLSEDGLHICHGKHTATVKHADPIFVDEPVLDDDGNPTGEVQQVFAGYTDPVDAEVEAWRGGIAMVSMSPAEGTALYLIHSSPETIAAMQSDARWLYVSEVDDAEG